MLAASFLGTLQHTRDRTVDGLDKRHYDDSERDAWRSVDAALDAVCDLVDLCLTAIPLPSTPGAVGCEGDSSVARLLDARFLTPMEEGWHRSPIDPDADPPADRIETVAEATLVPLAGSGPYAANWYVLFDRLATHATAVTTDCRRLAGRQRIDGATQLATAWEGVADLLSDLVTFIEFARSASIWASRPDREVVRRSDSTLQAAQNLTETTNTL